MRRQRGRPWRLGKAAIPAASVLILLVLIVTSVVTFERVRSVLDTKDWVAHTYQVRGNLEEAYNTVVTAESDVRAFVISQDRVSFERYQASEQVAREQISMLRDLTADNPSQGPRLDRLEKAISDRYEAMLRTVTVRQSRDLQGTVDELTKGPNRGRGLAAMNEVRASIAALVAEENRKLAERTEQSRGKTLVAEISFGFSIAISVLLISVFGFLSNRVVRVQEAAADEERLLRTGLEQEIERTKAAEARLERTMVELQRSNEELQNFAFVASHDLQEPLRKIRAFSDRVRRRAGDALDDESKDSLKRVEAAADRMQRLIMDLLELSRITTKVRPHVRIDLGQVVAEVADDLQTRIEDSGGSIVFESLPAVVADPAQVRQLFQNLLANALKFRREGVPPLVNIEALTRKDGRIAVKVTDNGIGFEDKFADRIFVVFQRLHGRGEYEGSGIGLAIVRKIVERHGGTIQAKSNLGQGTAFLFDLPGETSRPLPNAIVNADEEE